ncbi:helix-turn-helix domain-containing protein [Burkholderia vietnamiensis]|uniref:GlxA family transcriptional regulator n=1 Tax=Burkholderia TaxID=32008 RepID=UPI00025F0D98|nr:MULTISPECIES: helix-turn-helix domain-containing protein [Burkholderia]AFJ90264.1 Transcriptional regulator, AraC family [Burkholderia sp. KJ006]MBR8085912.1 helix-turn-helix domain-containing protein [Burkholderia vietnamiensis]MCA8230328.1 helix-turn-helix domain-containing protein [Burkholderia vietnamiensis]MDN7555226.1 helix-turn-helix domain-containing protein [Burkholderia vietnamiensis]MDN7819814.1 helix-turn-helix domain-containing protein [Burkholderia vietnamiensis]
MTHTNVAHSVDEAEGDVGGRRSRKSREIGVVVFEGFSLLAAAAVCEVFEAANEIYAPQAASLPLYDVRFYSSRGGNVVWSSAVSVRTFACDAALADTFDAVFVAGGEGARRAARDARVIDWLRVVVPKAGMVETISEGRMLIDAARSGAHASDAVVVDYDGYGPARAALSLVERDLGGDAVRAIASRLALNDALVTAEHDDARHGAPVERVRAAADWLRRNCDRSISVSDAVRVAAMSERNFLRHFKQEIGTTPSEFLLQVRLERTVQLLMETDMPIGTIARQCGWGNGDRLAKIFRRHLDVTPSQYRLQARSNEDVRPI